MPHGSLPWTYPEGPNLFLHGPKKALKIKGQKKKKKEGKERSKLPLYSISLGTSRAKAVKGKWNPQFSLSLSESLWKDIHSSNGNSDGWRFELRGRSARRHVHRRRRSCLSSPRHRDPHPQGPLSLSLSS